MTTKSHSDEHRVTNQELLQNNIMQQNGTIPELDNSISSNGHFEIVSGNC